MRILLTILLSTIIMNTYATQQPRIGLALSGGGALGFAHIGALQALEEHGIYPDVIAGSSMGAIIGSLYANGYNAAAILEHVKTTKLYKCKNILRLQSFMRNTGVSSHVAIEEAMLKLIPHNSFDSLKKEMVVCVTNFDKGKAEYIDSGDQLIEYVVGSAAIPGIFDIKVINNTEYVDGGVMDNIPSLAIRERCDYLIGIDVVPFRYDLRKTKAIDVALKAMRLVIHENSKPGRSACDWLIECPGIVNYYEYDFDKYLELYELGYKVTKEYIKEKAMVPTVVDSLLNIIPNVAQ